MTCAEAIARVFADEQATLTVREVIDRVYALYPNRPWKENTIQLHLSGLSVNHPSGHHHPSLQRRAFLYYDGEGRYRRWYPTQALPASEPAKVDEGTDVASSDEEDALVSAISTTVSLERDLERALVRDPGQIEPGLELYQGSTASGQQVDTGTVGRIDLLAVDRDDGLVVIELKAGRASDQVCGQILRYMGWVGESLAEGRQVRGIIVAHEFDKSLVYAAKAMPTVTLKRYKMRFEFEDV